jgi:hypothetical protein
MIIENSEINLQQEIEKRVLKTGDSYIDAILYICDNHSLDPEYIAKHLPKPIIEKLKEEGESLNLLPKTSRLPI